MKKITFLFLLIAASVTSYAQTITAEYHFATDLEGWAAGNGATVTFDAAAGFTDVGALKLDSGNKKIAKNTSVAVSGVGDYVLTYKVRGTTGDKIRAQWKVGSAASNQLTTITLPGAATGADTDATWMEVTENFALTTAETAIQLQFKSLTANAIFYIDDVVVTKQPVTGNTLTVNVAGGGTVAKSPDQAQYAATDVVTLTPTPTTHWQFDSWTGDLTGTTNPGSVTMDADKVITANFVTVPGFVFDFPFDTDGEQEGWDKTTGSDVVAVAGGNLTLTSSLNKFCKLQLQNSPVPAGSYQYVNITLQNMSTVNDELKVVAGADATPVQTITTNDTATQVYQFDLSALASWTGNVADVTFRFSKAGNNNKSGEVADFIIDRIQFTNTLLSVNEYSNKVKFSLYPNPAATYLTINSATQINEVKVMDITGKQVLNVANYNNENINISTLSNGVYMVSVKDVNNNLSVKKLLIAK